MPFSSETMIVRLSKKRGHTDLDVISIMHNSFVPFGDIWNILLLAAYLSPLPGTKQYVFPNVEMFFFSPKANKQQKVTTPMHKSCLSTVSSP